MKRANTTQVITCPNDLIRIFVKYRIFRLDNGTGVVRFQIQDKRTRRWNDVQYTCTKTFFVSVLRLLKEEQQFRYRPAQQRRVA